MSLPVDYSRVERGIINLNLVFVPTSLKSASQVVTAIKKIIPFSSSVSQLRASHKDLRASSASQLGDNHKLVKSASRVVDNIEKIPLPPRGSSRKMTGITASQAV